MTKRQRNNLIKLAKYLAQPKKNLKAKFSMEYYTDNHHHTGYSTECGTVGCAAGHGPYAGIKKYKNECWYKYVERAFGVKLASDWLYLFSTYWINHDNTPKGTAKRIIHYLENGVPYKFDIDEHNCKYLSDDNISWILFSPKAYYGKINLKKELAKL